METNQQRIMNSLKGKGPEAWGAYLRRFEDDPKLTSGLSMQVIFHHVAPLAKKQESLDWGEIAVRAAELESRTSNEIVREWWRERAMGLRAWFISKKGSVSNHLVLDKDVILNWVMEGLKLPVQSVTEKISSLAEIRELTKKSSDAEDRQRLRDDLSDLFRIKHRLNVVKVLVDCGELVCDPRLDEWLKIRDQLP